MGNRSFYHDGWKLVTLHRPRADYDDAEWELYDIRNDPTERVNLAAERPELVRELSLAWEKAAWENKVFPLNDFTGYLGTVRRPFEDRLTEPVRILAGTPTLERYRSAKLITLRSFTATASLTHDVSNEGVLFAHGDQGGGYVLYVEDGHAHVAYNEYGELLEADAGVLSSGAHDVSLEATAVDDYRWNLNVVVDGEARAQLKGVSMLLGLAPLQGIDVGVDRGSPVSWPLFQRRGSFAYQGVLHAVTYVPGEYAPYSPERVLAATIEAAHAYE
jgi:arylsulfatase